MRIDNKKTGYAYFAYTIKTASGYVSVVSRSNGQHEKLMKRATHVSRGKAYRHAINVCKIMAQNHAWVS